MPHAVEMPSFLADDTGPMLSSCIEYFFCSIRARGLDVMKGFGKGIFDMQKDARLP